MLEALDWLLWKQRDILHQIMTIKERSESGQPIEQAGYIPDGMTPQGLINIHKDRYNILEIAKYCSEDTLKKWIDETKKRIKCDDWCEKCYLARMELELLEEYVNAS